MMPDLARIYDRSFFEEWGPGHEKYVESAGIIAGVLHELLRPKRLVDLGAGCGIYSHLFAQKGVEVLAIDGVAPPPELSYPVPPHVRVAPRPRAKTFGPFARRGFFPGGTFISPL